MGHDRDFFTTCISCCLFKPSVWVARLHALDLEVNVRNVRDDIRAVLAARVLLPTLGLEAVLAQECSELALSTLSFDT